MDYKIQVIYFNTKKTHRILQNVGGPCPLLGLCNVLLLNNDIRVNHKITRIKYSDLTHCLKDHLHKLFEVQIGSKDDVDATQTANAIQNIEDCYQQQLTAHGLVRLHETMNENETAILFRNNHFSAVYKREGYIWELVTDEGIVDADPNITWVTVSQLNGDEDFANNRFQLISGNNNQRQQFESYKQSQVQNTTKPSNESKLVPPTDPNHDSQNTTDSFGIPVGLSAAEQEAYLLSLSEQSAKEHAAEMQATNKVEIENASNAENAEKVPDGVTTERTKVEKPKEPNTEAVDMDIEDEEEAANGGIPSNIDAMDSEKAKEMIQSEEQRSIDQEKEEKADIDAVIVPQNQQVPVVSPQSIETEDDKLAQKLQLQEQLGLSDAEFEQMQREQKAALEESEKSKITSSKGLGCFQKPVEQSDAELADAIYAQQLQDSYNQEKRVPNDQYGNHPYNRTTYNNRTHQRNVSPQKRSRSSRSNYKSGRRHKKDDSCIVL